MQISIAIESAAQRRNGLLLLLACTAAPLMVAACGTETPPPSAPDPATVGAGEVSPEAAVRAAFVRSQQALGAELPAFHFAAAAQSGSLVARHPAQGYVATLRPTGIEVAVGQDALRLGPAQLDCGMRVSGFETVAAQYDKDSAPHRASYPRRPLVEWYENGPLGLEQLFTIDKAPSGCDRQAPLRVELRVDGLRATAAGQGAWFVNDAGQHVLAYSDLYAKDQTGKPLPTRLRIDEDGRKLVLEIEWVGAIFPLEIDPLIWSLSQRLVSSDRKDIDDFGTDVVLSLDGNTALIGARLTDDGALANGAAYVFVRSGTTWTEQKKLLVSDKANYDFFGSSVALSQDGNTALIGADFKVDGGIDQVGAAYVFVRSGTTWTEQKKFLAGDRAKNDHFGMAVALSTDGNTALVAAPRKTEGGILEAGAVYVYTRSGTAWTQQQKILASDRGYQDYFGTAMALSTDGNIALIGAPYEGSHLNGAAYVFTRSGGLYTEQKKLTAGDRADFDSFGSAVGLSANGNIALIAAREKAEGMSRAVGAAYVFVQSGASWTQQQKLQASDKAAMDYFGMSVALSSEGNVALIGASNKDYGTSKFNGAAYAFVRSGASWLEQRKFLADDRNAGDSFGNAVALSSDGAIALIGASNKFETGFGATGAAYMFTSPKGNGITCSKNTDCDSGYCVDNVCCNSSCGGGVGSDCQACSKAAGASRDGTCGPINAGVICRPGFGACDQAESCDGTSTACPSDGLQAAGTQCRAAAGPCDVAETCSGTSAVCPADAFTSTFLICRAAVGLCDVAEVCTGTSAACPTDGLASAATVCRAAAGPCDNAETCTGTSSACPADALKSSSTTCRAAAGPCDNAEKCSGTSAACPIDKLKTNTSICRAAQRACDAAEFCSGTGAACPTDQYKPMLAVCRPAVGLCDLADYCTGSSPACPPDDLAPAGNICRPATNSCDLDEVCSGSSAACPLDKARPDGTSCTGGMCSAGICI